MMDGVTTHTGRRQHGRGVAALGVTLLWLTLAGLAGCAAPGGPAQPSGGAAPSATAVDVAAMVGRWTMTGTGDPDTEGVVDLDAYAVRGYLACGVVEAPWVASPSGQMRIAALGYTDGCEAAAGSGPLAAARQVRFAGPAMEFLDRSGVVVVRLTPGGTPSVDPTRMLVPEAPTPDAGTRAALAPGRPALPAGVTAPAAADLVGTWLATTGTVAASVTLREDGTWQGTDGCNGQSGVWLVDAGGWWRAAAGLQTEMWCDGADVGGMLVRAAQVGLADNGETLVLMDVSGTEVGRLVRASHQPEPT